MKGMLHRNIMLMRCLISFIIVCFGLCVLVNKYLIDILLGLQDFVQSACYTVHHIGLLEVTSLLHINMLMKPETSCIENHSTPK
jgi:hypothetical protein